MRRTTLSMLIALIRTKDSLPFSRIHVPLETVSDSRMKPNETVPGRSLFSNVDSSELKKQENRYIGTPTAVNDELTSDNRSSNIESHDLSRDTLRNDLHENRKPVTYSQDSRLQFQNKSPVRIQGLRNGHETFTSHQTQGSRDELIDSTLADDIEFSSYVRKRSKRFYV